MLKNIGNRIISHKIWSVVIILAVGFIIRKIWPTSIAVQPITAADLYTVGTGTIENTMKVTGKTSLINHQSLTFAQVGKVTKVYVKEGDKVKMGQLLAEIDKTDIMLNIAQQRIAVGNAQLQYNKLINSSTTNAIQQQSNRDDADRRLTSARQNLIDITNEMDRKLQDQQDTISELQQQLTILQASDSSSVQTYSTVAASASTDAMNTIATIGDAIASMDAILHTNRPGDQSLIYLGAKNPSSLSNAQGDIERLRSTFSTFQTAYQTFNAASAKTLDVILALQNANKDLNTIFATTTQDMLVMINASIPDATYLPDSTISSYRSTISSLNSKAISSVASITTAIQTSQNSVSDITKVQNNLASAQRTLIQLQQDYTSKIQQAKDTIASDESALAVAQATLDSNVNGANANDIALQRNSIANASISLQKLQNQLKDYELRAVFDGTVSDVGFVVGDTPSTNKSTTDKALTISNPNLYEIDMMIDQIDIVNIREGQQVNYTFDAYPNKVFTGVISAVVSTPVTDQGVTSFTVKVIGEKGSDPIYDQMSVNVNIILDKKSDILVVPTAAIHGTETRKTVQLYTNSKATAVPVEVGITDGKRTEITSGLEEGDTIVLTRYTAQSSSGAGGFSLFGGAGAPKGAAGGTTRAAGSTFRPAQ